MAFAGMKWMEAILCINLVRPMMSRILVSASSVGAGACMVVAGRGGTAARGASAVAAGEIVAHGVPRSGSLGASWLLLVSAAHAAIPGFAGVHGLRWNLITGGLGPLFDAAPQASHASSSVGIAAA